MSFTWRESVLHVEGLPAPWLAEQFGTPLYVYSRQTLIEAVQRFRQAFAPLAPEIHYALKANSNPHLLRELLALDLGVDVVSGGELEIAWLAGASMPQIAFAGVGKTDVELRAALDGRFSGIPDEIADSWGRGSARERGPVGRLHVESASELERVRRIARELGVRASIAIRVNPDVDAGTHQYTTTGRNENKFGVPPEVAIDLARRVARDPSLQFDGLHAHIGSPVTQVSPYLKTISLLLDLKFQLEAEGIPVASFDLGGGWPVPYRPGEFFAIETFAAPICEALHPLMASRTKFLLEPGRYLMAQAGILLTRVTAVKRGDRRSFLIVDAGLHTLIRPSLYGAYHFLWPVVASAHPHNWSPEAGPDIPEGHLSSIDVVGPLCETGDFLAEARPLPPMAEGELLAVFGAGAYGMSMASNYNLQTRPAEVLVDGSRATLIRRRERLSDLLATVPVEIKTTGVFARKSSVGQ